VKILTSNSIRKLLKTNRLGKVDYLFEKVGSTNEVAVELARNSAQGTTVFADSQTK
jgi:hypothetical protein